MPTTLVDIPEVSLGDIDVASIDYTPYLDAGELLTGTPTVNEVTTTDLTFANKAVNIAAVVIKGVTVAIGKAVQFKFSGQQQAADGSPKLYRVRVSVLTNATIARTKVVDVRFRCR